MRELQRRNWRLFGEELVRLGPLLTTLLFTYFAFVIPFYPLLVAWPVHALMAYGRAAERRFWSPKLKEKWLAVRERMVLLNDAVRAAKRDRVVTVTELPKTISRVADNIYTALRKADLVVMAISKSEHKMTTRFIPEASKSAVPDAQATELYSVADRNVAEYRQRYNDLMGSVHRTEAQAEVFITTLDNLRIQMLSHNLVGKKSDLDSSDFLFSMKEVRAQLDAIDQALDELDLGYGIKTIVVDRPNSVPDRLGEQSTTAQDEPQSTQEHTQ